MLRAVMAVALATALLAVSLPAIDSAGISRASASVRADTAELAAAVRDLQTSDGAVPPDAIGARRVVSVHLPSRSWTSAGVAYLAIGGRIASGRDDRNETAFAWRVEGGTVRVRRLPGVRLERAGDGDAPLVLREPGVHRLELTLVERAGNHTVVVRRLSRPRPEAEVYE